jgi:hypothetical protein
VSGARAQTVALTAVALLVAVLAVRQADRGGIVTSDTLRLLDSVGAVDACLEAGDWRCHAGVDKWPLLQHVPGVALKRLGRSRAEVGNDLVLLNGLATIGMLIVLWLVTRREPPPIRAIALLGALVSPLLWYAATGFGEPLAAFFTLLAVAGVLRSWPLALVLAAAFFAGISKEVAPPFVALLALAAGAVAGNWRSRAALAACAGAALGLVVNGLFNQFRYGSFSNVVYTDPDYRVHDLARQGDAALAQLVSPNAGILWFWPVAAAVLVIAAVAAVRRLRADRHDRGALGIAAALAALALLIVSFSAWWSPYGWSAYGARLVVPWLPAVALVALIGARETVERVAARVLRRTWAAVGVAAVALAFGLPALGMHLEPVTPVSYLSEPKTACLIPRVEERVAAGDAAVREQHLHCLSDGAWRTRPVMLEGFRPLDGANLAIAALFGIAIGALVACARSGRA